MSNSHGFVWKDRRSSTVDDGLRENGVLKRVREGDDERERGESRVRTTAAYGGRPSGGGGGRPPGAGMMA